MLSCRLWLSAHISSDATRQTSNTSSPRRRVDACQRLSESHGCICAQDVKKELVFLLKPSELTLIFPKIRPVWRTRNVNRQSGTVFGRAQQAQEPMLSVDTTRKYLRSAPEIIAGLWLRESFAYLQEGGNCAIWAQERENLYIAAQVVGARPRHWGDMTRYACLANNTRRDWRQARYHNVEFRGVKFRTANNLDAAKH